MLDLRRRWHRVMEEEISLQVEELTGHKVIGFMSDNHIDPDLAVEVFVLQPLSAPPAGGPSQPTHPSSISLRLALDAR